MKFLVVVTPPSIYQFDLLYDELEDTKLLTLEAIILVLGE